MLKTRSLEDKVNFSTLEKHFKLPDKYHLFLKTFIVGDNSLFSQEYIDLKYNNKRTLLVCVYEPLKDICFTGFNTIEDAIVLKKDLEEYEFSRFLPIGFSSYNAGIVVSTDGDDQDVIYFDDPESNDEMIKLSDNIFDFVKGLSLDYNQNNKRDNSKLYKNWGEDFWRVKG